LRKNWRLCARECEASSISPQVAAKLPGLFVFYSVQKTVIISRALFNKRAILFKLIQANLEDIGYGG